MAEKFDERESVGGRGAGVTHPFDGLSDGVRTPQPRREAYQGDAAKAVWLPNERVAKACIETRAGLVFVSTTSVYGARGDRVDESAPAQGMRPESPYAASKLRAEDVLQGLAANAGLRHVTLRFGTIFGPSEKAFAGFSWVSMNTPSHPAATAARASTGARMPSPEVVVPAPPGLCTEWVASNTTR